jgi:putative addiction module CopG family antidote
MAYALAGENEEFIARMIRIGRFSNQSEVVREALRRMEREEASYLNPPPLTQAEAGRCFAPNAAEDRCELEGVNQAAESLRRLARKHKGFDEL